MKKGKWSGKRNGNGDNNTTAQSASVSAATTQNGAAAQGATTTQGATTSVAQAQQKKPATSTPGNLNQMEWSDVAGELAKAQVRTNERVDKLEAAVNALTKGESPKPDTGEVVDAYRYYPGGDKSKPLSDPTLKYWVAVQATDYKVELIYRVKARLYGDGRLVALSPEEAAKYA
ncbi:hypothetical protein IIY68_01770 [Candidatus Saccharibacteria bacterium]|nr:hypothetical protein [Candidatus Saccharibacteria bacterium]